jgi:sigma-B regulation protein RsbU (phosphoserine phosphatase)
MALSRTLLRTYAGEYPTRADRVLAAVNERILSEARAGLFVTVFYAILDPASGTLTYANAGHHPPYVLSPPGGATPRVLTRTGMALGVLESEWWSQETLVLGPSDMLLLYTDGVTDALGPQDAPFGTERLLQAVQQHVPGPPADVQAAILAALDGFAGDTPQLDDITLVVLGRNA